MPPLQVPQHTDWSNNIYVLTATRVLVMIGVAYLIKSLYSLVPSIWGTRSASIAAGALPCTPHIDQGETSAKGSLLTSFSNRIAVEDGIGLENIISDTSLTFPGTGGTGPDLDANLALEVRTPPPSYDRHGRAEGSRFNTRAQDESAEVSASFTTNHTVPEQDVGVHNGDPHTEEEQLDVAVGLPG